MSSVFMARDTSESCASFQKVRKKLSPSSLYNKGSFNTSRASSSKPENMSSVSADQAKPVDVPPVPRERASTSYKSGCVAGARIDW